MSIRDYIENLRYEREKQQKKETAMKVLSGLAIGTVIGGVIGILFAPKAGKETRQEISEKVKETAAVTGEKVKETLQEVKDKVEELKDKKLTMVDKTTDSAGDL
jgi:gas vesicle protein